MVTVGPLEVVAAAVSDQSLVPSALAARTCTWYVVDASSPLSVVWSTLPVRAWPPGSPGSIQSSSSAGGALPA